jgi:hypothetical protein
MTNWKIVEWFAFYEKQIKKVAHTRNYKRRRDPFKKAMDKGYAMACEDFLRILKQLWKLQ